MPTKVCKTSKRNLKSRGVSKVCSGALLAVLLLGGCASNKAGYEAPELPPRHWLEEAPGVPVEHKAKLEAALPNLYNANKSLDFEDYVYLSIQQSPLLASSAVDLEIQKLQLTDAIWRYIPEPTASVRISNNITTYNQGLDDLPQNYAQPKYEVNFTAMLPNPIGTYFNHQAQKILVDMAISTHRKAIGKVIADIARLYLEIDAQKEIIALNKQLIPIMKKNVTYWKQLESADGSQGVALNLAVQRQREAELKVESAEIKASVMRTRLKRMAGLANEQKLTINTEDAKNIVANFDGKKLQWEERWAKSEDQFMLRSQLRLQDYNIMLAWAKYIPDVSLMVNNYPPSGQAQPVDGQEDTFLHVSFDFPIIDWGRRYRGVQSARMQKAQAYQEQAQERTSYSNDWVELEQNVSLAATSLKIAKTALDVAEMHVKEAEINYKEGLITYDALASRKEGHIKSQISYVETALDYKLNQIVWMNKSGVLGERYIGLPSQELE